MKWRRQTLTNPEIRAEVRAWLGLGEAQRRDWTWEA